MGLGLNLFLLLIGVFDSPTPNLDVKFIPGHLSLQLFQLIQQVIIVLNSSRIYEEFLSLFDILHLLGYLVLKIFQLVDVHLLTDLLDSL
mmetsp:Transcript_38688/g.37034  ORF Transcript_38688/g.37034 Transcript_38688/m.37034 type:complete len:89 (+) Transcript_38688:125-391(+)